MTVGDSITYIGVSAIGAHILLFICIVIAYVKKYGCQRRTKTRYYQNTNTFSAEQISRQPEANRSVTTISNGVLNVNQSSAGQSNVHMSPMLLDAVVHGYHASRQTREQTSSDPEIHSLSPTEHCDLDQYDEESSVSSMTTSCPPYLEHEGQHMEQFDLNQCDEESRNSPISPPCPPYTEHEDRYVGQFFPTDYPGDCFQDWPDDPPPAYSSLFEIVRPADALLLK
ncbi:uncharacterized protein LOC134246705 isoform X1 [Saccostrea cucullata]|uniref:uncharacterized protein LOC134246705 isoform X1 n=1 Tax=Saccostrea cuccullata TaxID=36930 RepID=UPI002ED18D86